MVGTGSKTFAIAFTGLKMVTDDAVFETIRGKAVKKGDRRVPTVIFSLTHWCCYKVNTKLN